MGIQPVWKDLLPVQQLADLAEQVKKSNGKIVLLIHPFFWNDKKTEFNQYLNVVKKFIANSRFPVVVLEEEHKMAERKFSSHYPENNPNLFVFPTVLGVPQLSKEGHGIEKRGEQLADLLSTAGVKQILVGGSFSYRRRQHRLWTVLHEKIARDHERSWLPTSRDPDPRPIVEGCVGVYIDLINSKKFSKVRLIPNALWPDKPYYQVNDNLSLARMKGQFNRWTERRTKKKLKPG